jgi:hypothetical protein
MIKNLYHVLLLTLAINFLALAGGVGWLYKDGRLGQEQVAQIKQILYPPAVPPPADAEPDPTTRPAIDLEALLAKASGRTAAEQVEFLQQSFDAQTAQLDRRYRELLDLQRQIELAKQHLAADRANLAAGEQKLRDEQQLQEKLASDKGFQDSLSLYQTMPAKQVKQVFMSLDDETVVRYLQAMAPRTASKIVKEFRTPEETARVQRVLERMRQQTQQQQATQAPAESAGISNTSPPTAAAPGQGGRQANVAGP